MCTDWAASIISYHLRVTAKIREVANKDLTSHCVIYQEHLAAKKLLSKLNNIIYGPINFVSDAHG